jgi:hypothetical protein
MATDRTRTSIANMAADFLDTNQIGNINDDFGDAQIYKRNYEEAVETVIAEFTWNSATARARLSPLADTPEMALGHNGFQNVFALPSDCVAPVDINDRPIENLHWANETIAIVDQHGNVTSRRKVLYCDFPGPILLRYRCIVEPRDMSPHLAKAIALELAIRCTGKLNNSTTKKTELENSYSEATKGSTRRVGGFQVDSRANRPLPARQLPSSGQRARAGQGL